jgi:hypothetical protein
VLRPARDGRSIAREARIMDYVRAHGYPVPAVHEVRAGGTEIVMDTQRPVVVDWPNAVGAVRRPMSQRVVDD